MPTYQKLAVILLFFLTIFLGTFRLLESPAFNFDEGWYVQNATNIVERGQDGLQLAPLNIVHISKFTAVGYPFIYPLALWMNLVGTGVLEARMLSVIFLTGFVFAGYFFARKKFGDKIALVTLLLLATFPPLYGNGKAVMGEMPGLFYLAFFILFFAIYRSKTPRPLFWLILSGLFAGLCMVTKPAFIVLAPALLLSSVIEWRRGEMKLFEIGIAMLAVFAPIIIWFLVQFNSGDSFADILGFYANPSGLTDVSTYVLRNLTNLFTDVGPFFTVFLLAVWTAGIVLRLKEKTKISFEEIAAYAFSILVILAFLRTLGFYRYLFPVQAMSLIFFANSLNIATAFIQEKIRIAKQKWIFGICVAGISILGLYQLGFNSYVADTYSSNKMAKMQEYFATIPASSHVFFYNAPSMVPLFEGRNYYQYLILLDKWYVGEENRVLVQKGLADVLVLGAHPLEDEESGMFAKYEVDQVFDKVTIMNRKN